MDVLSLLFLFRYFSPVAVDFFATFLFCYSSFLLLFFFATLLFCYSSILLLSFLLLSFAPLTLSYFRYSLLFPTFRYSFPVAVDVHS